MTATTFTIRISDHFDPDTGFRTAGNNSSWNADISSDGRVIVYTSLANNPIVPGHLDVHNDTAMGPVGLHWGHSGRSHRRC